MEWLTDIVKLVSDLVGSATEWGTDRKAKVPWSEIYSSRRAVTKALKDKHRKPSTPPEG